jgi:hypothetical protein
MRIAHNPTRNALAFGGILLAALATPAAAETRMRLIDCEAGSCLLVTGHRADTASAVRINGHAVAARGARKWRVSIPMETLRQWSAPRARTITVSIADAEIQVALPIGLLGHAENLAFLTVSAK